MTPLLAATVRLATPLMLASTGGVLSERAGVAQLALEGMMLTGAYVAVASGGGLPGALAAGVVGSACGGTMGLVVERFHGSALLAGIGINLLAAGATTFLLRSHPGGALGGARLVDVEWFAGVALLGVAAVAAALKRFPIGLRIRACGENPLAARAAGITVSRVRTGTLAVSGAFAGLAGAALVLAGLGEFTENMTGGRGYLAVVAVLLGRWRPLPVALAALLFGFGDALQLWLRNEGSTVPADIQEMLPYALALVVLGAGRRSTGEPGSLARDGE